MVVMLEVHGSSVGGYVYNNNTLIPNNSPTLKREVSAALLARQQLQLRIHLV